MIKRYQINLKFIILNFLTFKGGGMSSNNFKIHKIPASKTNHHILNLLRKTEKSRGSWTEERFMRAIENSNGNAPDWLKGISRATKEEDRKGIDFIIHTVSGNVFVQIKSSEGGASIFKKRKSRNFRIIILVIKIDYDEEKIRNISFPTIQAEIDLFRKPSC